jgi:4-hydroxy-3-methylbut-2-enyl diphosphate reductase
VAQVRAFTPRDSKKLAFVTQTTLSVDDTAKIVGELKARFPDIVGPPKEDICYATTNRQAAVKAIAPKIDCLFVVGSPQSSNSLRLVEVAKRAGCANAHLIERSADIPWHLVAGIAAVGVTAGASAPESLVEEVIGAFRQRYDVTLETVTTARESIAFNVPRELRTAPAS